MGQIRQLEALVQKAEIEANIEIPVEVQKFLKSEIYERAICDHERLEMYLNKMENFDFDWEVYSQVDNTTIYYRTNNENSEDKLLTFGGESIINAPFFYVLTVLGEYKQLSDWIPFLASVDILHERSPFKRLLHGKIDLPILFANRDIVGEVTGFADKEEKSYCLVLESERTGSYFESEIDDEGEGRARVDLRDGFIHLQKIDETTCKLKIIMSVDTGIDLGQGWTGRMIMNKVASVWIVGIKELSEDFKNTTFAKSLIKNPIYRYTSKKLDIPIPAKEEMFDL